MGSYKITRKGKIFFSILTFIAIVSLVKGSIFLAIFSFIFFSVVLLITLYELFAKQ